MNKKLRRRLSIASGIVLVVAAILIYNSVYFSPEIRARVVTPGGQSVEGVIVVASWSVTESWNGMPLGQLALYEAVTDKNGEFRIPQWGPRYLTKGSIYASEPIVRFFHPDYVPLVTNNGLTSSMASGIMSFRLQDQAIILTPFHGSLGQYESELAGLKRSLEFFWSDPSVLPQGMKRCYWQDIPKLLIALQRVKDSLVLEGVGKSIPSIQEYVAFDRPGCGDSEYFFQGYIK